MNSLKFFLVFILASFSSLHAQTTRFEGTWHGIISVGVELRIVFHVVTDPKGGLTSTADSPDQSAFGLKCDTTIVKGDEILIEMRQMQASYVGKLINDTTIQGSFKQQMTIPLNLKKGGVIAKRNRPQTPVPPFPYKSEDIIYSNKDSSLQYGATITFPTAPGTYPAILLITGSGSQNRDEEIMGHKSFAVIADHLTRLGYIILRVDDRGVGQSTTSGEDATSEDFADDVSAGIDYLLSRKEVNRKKIGLLGHSEGGMIAPIVASKRNDIAFMILLAAPGIPIVELMADQNEAIARANGLSASTVKEIKPLFKSVVKAIMNLPDSSKAIEEVTRLTEEWAARQINTTLKELDFESVDKRRDYIYGMVTEFQSPWFRYFIQFNPAIYLEKLNGKVLALNGGEDIQVIAKNNLAGIEAALRKSRVKQYTVRELPGMNHLFQSCKKCTVQEYAELEETISPTVLKLVADWLEKEVK